MGKVNGFGRTFKWMATRVVTNDRAIMNGAKTWAEALSGKITINLMFLSEEKMKSLVLTRNAKVY